MISLDPTIWFATPPGTDGALLHRTSIRTWLKHLTDASTHMQMRTIATSTEGRPLDAIFISHNLDRDRLNELRQHREHVINDAIHGGSMDQESLPVVLITSGIHATEIGGPQSIPALLHWLATSDEAAPIRERVLTIVVPTLNPDGFDLVTRWHRDTLTSPDAGTLPPLLYHRFAGHDNNRDWLYRNLAETRMLLDGIHAVWWPHVTLDQHQMHQHGPRFALPPYADPWEPHIHPSIIAASSALGQAIAADMTLGGLRGVMTSEYFDAWEPSRALQHYRGGIRILAEAASADLARPVEITKDQLAGDPLPQPATPTASSPAPWPGGRWGLSDIVAYHLTAAKSLLVRVAAEPDRWPAIQHDALATGANTKAMFRVASGNEVIDSGANERLSRMLAAAATAVDPANAPAGPLAEAVLHPKLYPAEHGSTAYDVTTHDLPLMMGATVHPAGTNVSDQSSETAIDESHRYLMIDARCHAAPNVVEPVLRAATPAAWRASSRSIADGHLIEPGSWIVDRTAHPAPDEVAPLARASLRLLPGNAVPVDRRDILLLNLADRPSEDHGWTRWWLHARRVPFLETDAGRSPRIQDLSSALTVLVADTPAASMVAGATDHVRLLVASGATVIAFGASGRELAAGLSDGVGLPKLSRNGSFRAPGSLLRLTLQPGSPLGAGLDRSIPAMYQRDGVFAVSRSAHSVDVLARFADRDTLISGWISSVVPLRNAPAVISVRYGDGVLYAFSFRPLFRGQMLVTSPLVHNLMYPIAETATCPPSGPEKMPAASTSDHMS